MIEIRPFRTEDQAEVVAGLGRAMMAAAEARLRVLGCPKVNLQIRRDNPEVVAFYARLGYLEDAVVSLGKRLEQD